jgi:hypothetical protein
MRTLSRLLALAALALTGLSPATISAARALRATGVPSVSLPLSFEPNRGQAPSAIRYLARGPGYTLFLTERGIVLSLASAGPPITRPALDAPPSVNRTPLTRSVVSLFPTGTSSRMTLRAGRRLGGTVNYLLGRNPRGWHTGIPTYAGITYRHVYPGIDLHVYGAGPVAEYDWVVRPHADLLSIGMRVTGNWRISHGNLLTHTGSGVLLQSRPRIYQVVNGTRVPVVGSYTFRDDRIGFSVGRYNHRRPLVIDPVLSYGTVVGGSDSDYAAAVAVGADGSAYIVGTTDSTDFPVVHGYQMFFPGPAAGENGFVSRLSPDGTSLLYSTFIGGSANDAPVSVAVNAAGDASIAGFTRSTDFPTVHPLPLKDGGDCSRPAGGGSAMIATLAPGGKKLLFSTCLGADGTTWANHIAYDASGALHLTGSTSAQQFPLVQPVQTDPGGGADAFVATIAGGQLRFSTYLGGSGGEDGTSIALDSQGDVYIAGGTTSSDFPTVGAAQSTASGGPDAFVARFDSANRLVWSTYLGGSGDDDAWSLTTVSDDGVAVTGSTTSTDFPTAHAIQSQADGHTDAFVTRLNASGQIMYSTYLGGLSDDAANGTAAAPDGSVYIVGETSSPNFPQVDPLQPGFGGGFEDAFLTRIAADGSGLVSSTFIGGSQGDAATSVAVGQADAVYVAGGTSSSDFPVTSGVTGSSPGRGNAFVVKITNQIPVKPHITINNVWLYNLSDQSTTHTAAIKMRQQALFVVDYRDTNVHPGKASATIRFSLHGRTVRTLTMHPGGSLDGTPSFYVHYRFPHGDIGSVQAHIRISMQGAIATRLFKFQVEL